MSNRTVADFGERALIQRITARLALPRWVVVGPGDDAAVIEPERGSLEVLTTDAQIEGVHFDRRFVPSDAVGHRALAVNLSDLAAMGARPRAALLSLALPDALDIDDLDGLVRGLLAVAERHRVALIGGNITRSPGPLMVDVTATGSVRPRRAIKRDGARPGDEVYVTGSIGDAAVGLRVLQANVLTSVGSSGAFQNDDGRAAHGCCERYLRPEPRVRAGLLLGGNRAASACVDLSDGLADGVRQLADSSDVGIVLDADAIPITADARQWHLQNGTDAVEAAITGGDDYELLFTARPAHRSRLRSVRRYVGDLPITKIGVVTKQRGVLIRTAAGEREVPHGFDHFK